MPHEESRQGRGFPFSAGIVKYIALLQGGNKKFSLLFTHPPTHPIRVIMSLLSEEMMDEATTDLILQLHWEDIKTLEFKGKGKESAGLSDAELALQF